MKASLAAGVTSTVELIVDRERTIGFMGEKARVYATPMLVRDIELASRDLLLAHLDPGEDSVGTRIELDHLAATLLGMKAEITVTVAAVNGRAVTFEVSGRDGVDLICRGKHSRFVVDVKKTEERLAAKAQKAGIELAMSDSGTRRVPTYCYQCVAGPDLLTVKVVDGIATEVEPNFCAADAHPGGGKVCVKAYGLVQKTYNPHRILTPMKRTNPRKGVAEDPGFVPITWEEAFDIVAARLNKARADGLTDESGYPRLAVSLGGAGTPQSYMGTFPAFLAAWGAVDMGFGSGQGVKCYHSEHLYGEFWHRAFTVSPDTPLCDYLISCGANVEASGGVVGVWRHANARIRGMKRVQVEPHLSVTGACSAEWVPIKPKTDASFLYALVHVLLHGFPRERLDLPFLTKHTASPYLVGRARLLPARPRDAKAAGLGHGARRRGGPRCARHRRGARRPLRRGRGRDRPRRRHARRRRPRPARRRFSTARCAHGALFARVGRGDLRSAGDDDAPDRARVPRPRESRRDDRDRWPATALPPGRGQPRQDRQQRLGRLRVRVGAHDAGRARRAASKSPGGTLGTTVRLNRQVPARVDSVLPGPDGFMDYPLNPTDKAHWSPNPNIRNAYRTMVPLAANGPWSQALGPTHFSWMFLDETPKGLPRVTLARRLDRLPDQSGDLVLGHRPDRRNDGALPVHGRLRLHA